MRMHTTRLAPPSPTGPLAPKRRVMELSTARATRTAQAASPAPGGGDPLARWFERLARAIVFPGGVPRR